MLFPVELINEIYFPWGQDYFLVNVQKLVELITDLYQSY